MAVYFFMSSLTETAYYARRAINWTILGIIAYIILRIFWSIFVVFWIAIFPARPPPPNHAFGKLPAISFPQQATPSSQITYQLETIQGSVPAASSSAAVYFMPKAAPNLLALTTTQDFASKLQFNPAPIQESKNIYRFDDTEFPLRKLRYDIVSSNFIVRYAFESDMSVFVEKNLPSAGQAKQETANMLQSYNLYPNDVKGGQVILAYLRLQGNRLVPTTSLSEADAVSVEYFKKPVGDMPIVTPYPDEAPISIILSGSNNAKKRMIQFAYTYWPIDYQTYATYALKTSTQAWNELKEGKGYTARYPTNTSSVVVRNVSLAYYDSFDPQTYLQPIFVFQGDNGFLGYVPAVNPEWAQ
jgi:hypothetical protein